MRKGPKNWTNGRRDGAGSVKHPQDDVRTTAVKEEGLEPQERRTRQINFRGTESLKARIVRLSIRHKIKAYEVLEWAVTALEEKQHGEKTDA